MQEVFITDNSDVGKAIATSEKQDDIISKLEDIEVLVTLPQDLTPTGSPTFANETLTGLEASKMVFTDGNKKLVSGGTDVTAEELEELTDGSETELHSHAGGAGGNCSMLTGVYTGNGASEQEIDVGVDLASKTHVYIIIKALTTGAEEGAMHRIEYGQGALTMVYTNTADSIYGIKNLSSVGFVLVNNGYANKSAVLYRYIVFWVD